ncbi:MAG: hypothetical protein AUG51_04085 [Acidobacteria bacterium 13_1_20CM_3_53_8]|nr:MAG: hypothetical protein AUG51_04085 [Acidobacteria bacterium 13_1_20CM_3_53_8]
MGVQGKGRITALLTIFTIALLVVSCGNKRSVGTGVAPAAVVPQPVARTLAPLPLRPLSPKLQEMREHAMRRASELRGLDWTGDVGMTELSGWEYGQRASEMAQVLGGDDLRSLGRLAAAGGALPEGVDLAQLAASFAAVSAGAVYSPLDHQVILVDKFKGDSLLTHEFTHALQDQHFDLLKLLLKRPYNFDRTEAVFAVVEGDAMNVQRRDEEGDAFGRKPLDEIARSEGARFNSYREEVGALFPKLLTETFIFRYRDGARFVEAVRRRGGERAVDELFTNPPQSSEQILHPEKYFQSESPRDVQLDESLFAANGWKLAASTPLGEIGVRGLLMGGVMDEEALRAAAGWGGDRAYLFERAGATPLFVWKTVWDRQLDAQEFLRAYISLQNKRQGAAGSGNNSVANESQAIWRDAGRTTIAWISNDTVIIVRGAEADAGTALEFAKQ